MLRKNMRKVNEAALWIILALIGIMLFVGRINAAESKVITMDAITITGDRDFQPTKIWTIDDILMVADQDLSFEEIHKLAMKKIKRARIKRMVADMVTESKTEITILDGIIELGR